MLLIDCPFCGGRAQTEFAYYGEAHIARPEKPEALSDAEWADYVFLRTNPKGIHFERWMHIHGCRRFFNMMRDTVSGEIHATYQIGDNKPDIPAAAKADDAAVNATKTATIGKSKTESGGSKAATSADGDKGKAATDNKGGDNPATTKAAASGGDDNNVADNKGKGGDNADNKGGRGQ